MVYRKDVVHLLHPFFILINNLKINENIHNYSV